MSAIAAIYNVPGTPEELAQWSTAHARHHVDINRVIFQLAQIEIPAFVLDPFDVNNAWVWQDQHQIMHNYMDAVLNISGFALTNTNFADKEAFAGWIYLNAQEHYLAANALGIG